jgi:amidohydrolase
MSKVLELAQDMKEELIELRRKIHMHPELGFEEHETASLVAKRLKEWGIETTTGVAKTGVIGIIHGKTINDRTIAIRADMDALPLQEANDVPYKSKIDGKMHACGHDAHTAILLGVAKILSQMREKINGKIKLFFQPAEEGLGGAKPMVEAGALQDPNVSAVIALHVYSDIDTGKIMVKDGSFTASSDKFWIDIIGKGGHAAAPHEANDPIVIASQIVTALQTISSRKTDPVHPVIVTIGTFNAGTAYNIIPEKAHLTGTIRALSPEVRKATFQHIQQLTEGIASSFDAKAEVKIKLGYSPGMNDSQLNNMIKKAAKEIIGEDNIIIGEYPMMGAEDFYDFSDDYRIPVSMFWLGVRNEEKGIVHPGHNPKFDVDEEALPLGAAILSLAALRYLQE